MINPLPSNTSEKLRSKLMTSLGKAISDYGLIKDGDTILVCLSGGKDSFTMLDLMLHLQTYAPVKFELIGMHLDQGHPGYPSDIMQDFFESLGIKYHIERQDTYSIVKRVIPEGKTMCGLCSRLRRGIIYKLAKDLKATKIALGHHRDDAIETLFLNLFYGGRLKSMPPKLLSDDKKNILIRPLYYCSEEDIARYANYRNFPIIPCNLCGSQEQLKRAEIKKMIADWKRTNPDVEQKIFRSMMNIDLSQLSDSTLFDFDELENFRD